LREFREYHLEQARSEFWVESGANFFSHSAEQLSNETGKQFIAVSAQLSVVPFDRHPSISLVSRGAGPKGVSRGSRIVECSLLNPFGLAITHSVKILPSMMGHDPIRANGIGQNLTGLTTCSQKQLHHARI